MNSNEEDAGGLHISISADADAATTAFTDLGKSVDGAAAGVAEANERITQSAQRAGEAISVAAGSSARDSAQMAHAFADSARLADQAVAETGSRAVSEAAQRGREILTEVKRQLGAVRDDVRAGELTQQDALKSSRGAMQLATVRPGGGEYTRTQLSVGNLEGDPEMQARYRAYVEAERQIRTIQDQMVRDQRLAVEQQIKADKQSTESATQSAKLRADALRDQVRSQQISLEEEGRLLQNARQQYSEYADARALIDKRIIDNQVRTNSEQARVQGGRGGVAGNSLLNAGYVVPGPVGNAITNLGYAAQGGPAEFAVLGGAIAAFGAGGALYKAAEIAAKDQEAMERLGTAVRTQGGDWKGLATNVDAWAQLQERTTIFGRDQTIPALTELATAGVKMGDAYKIVRVAEDASAATGKPLVDVAHQLLEAYNGNSRGLIQLGVVTREQVRDGMTFQQLLEAIEKNMSGQATDVAGYSRQMQVLGHDFEDLARNVGQELLPDLTKGVEKLDAFVRSVDTAKNIRTMAHDMRDAASAASQLVGGFVALGTDLDTINSAGEKFGQWVHQPFGALADFFGRDASTMPSGWSSANYGGMGAGGAAPGASRSQADPWAHLRGGGGFGEQESAPATGEVPGIESAIQAAAYRHNVSAALLRAVGLQESDLGRAGNYDRASGRSKDPGNMGYGPFQLDPASGASKADLERAAHDVGFAANKAAQMLADNLRAAHGNIAKAVAAYGPHDNPAYVGQVLARVPSMTLAGAQAAASSNPAYTNVSGRGQTGNPQSSDLDTLAMKYADDQKVGLTSARSNYESALVHCGGSPGHKSASPFRRLFVARRSNDSSFHAPRSSIRRKILRGFTTRTSAAVH